MRIAEDASDGVAWAKARKAIRICKSSLTSTDLHSRIMPSFCTRSNVFWALFHVDPQAISGRFYLLDREKSL